MAACRQPKEDIAPMQDNLDLTDYWSSFGCLELIKLLLEYMHLSLNFLESPTPPKKILAKIFGVKTSRYKS